jgi:hypothetical protein
MKVLPRLLVLLATALLPLNPAVAERAGASTKEDSTESEAPNKAPDNSIVTRPKLARAVPFKSVVFSVDPEGRNFRMGKKKIRLVLVTPETRFFRNDGRPATVHDLIPGTEIRGSTKKRDTGELEAATVKIGPKLTPEQIAAANREEE